MELFDRTDKLFFTFAVDRLADERRQGVFLHHDIMGIESVECSSGMSPFRICALSWASSSAVVLCVLLIGLLLPILTRWFACQFNKEQIPTTYSSGAGLGPMYLERARRATEAAPPEKIWMELGLLALGEFLYIHDRSADANALSAMTKWIGRLEEVLSHYPRTENLTGKYCA